jgi:hypothetical protein
MTVQRPHSRAAGRSLREAGNVIALARRENRRCLVNYNGILEAPDPTLQLEPDVATFRREMALLADCFIVLRLHEARQLPPRAVYITFDDGYRPVHDLVLPVLQEIGLLATVFVTSGDIGEPNIWDDRIIEAVQSLSPRRNLATMLQVSLAGYVTGGAFLSLAYFDLLYDILIIVVLLEKVPLTKSTPASLYAQVTPVTGSRNV